jgi:hypothetical protein
MDTVVLGYLLLGVGAVGFVVVQFLLNPEEMMTAADEFLSPDER